jgi:hypothetical protein
MIALALWAVPFTALVWLLFSLHRYTPQFGVYLWQKLPAALRLGSPRQMFHVADWILWLLFGLAAAIWLPVASTVAAAGWQVKRMFCSLRVLRHGRYWLWFAGLVLVGGYIPCRLVWWIPQFSDLRAQAWSAGSRFLAAYVVLISAWVALLLVVGEMVEQEDPGPIAVREETMRERL